MTVMPSQQSQARTDSAVFLSAPGDAYWPSYVRSSVLLGVYFTLTTDGEKAGTNAVSAPTASFFELIGIGDTL